MERAGKYRLFFFRYSGKPQVDNPQALGYNQHKGSVNFLSIMRVHKTKNFTVMSNHHFKEKEMSLKAKGLLSLMLSLPDNWNYSISGLVKLSKDGKDSVMSALTELEKFGYLTRIRMVNEKGQFSGVEYNIFEQPQEQNPVSENQNSGNENAENQNAENPPQLNTKSSSTKGNKVMYNINNYIHILDTVGDEQLRNLFVDFLEMRNYMGDPLTVRGLELLRERLRELVGLDIAKQKDLLRTAVINNWKNVYPKGEAPVENPEYDALKSFYSSNDQLIG